MLEIPYQKIVVFDFDGTIAKTDGLLFDIYNKIAPTIAITPLDANYLSAIKEMKAKQILEHLNIPWYKLPTLWRKMTSQLSLYRKEISLHAGIPELLFMLKNKGVPFGVISSNSKENIEAVFILNNLPKPLFIGCSSALLNKYKIYEKVVKSHTHNLKDSIYIGDESRDIEVGKKLNLPVISVTWGFASKANLINAGASVICETVNDLENEINHFLSR